MTGGLPAAKVEATRENSSAIFAPALSIVFSRGEKFNINIRPDYDNHSSPNPRRLEPKALWEDFPGASH